MAGVGDSVVVGVRGKASGNVGEGVSCGVGVGVVVGIAVMARAELARVWSWPLGPA